MDVGQDADDGQGAAAALPQVTYLREPAGHDVDVTVVTLLVRDDGYETMLKSAVAKGFTEDRAQFIALDNRGENRFDGYQAIRRALPECRGRYILFCHDDVEFTGETLDELIALLERLEAAHPRWMLAGNSGNPATGKVVNWTHIDDPLGARRVDGFKRVNSLDENFFVMKRDRAALGSIDLAGFHLYATDLCLIAEVMGGEAYVIPFALTHHSRGSLSEDSEAARQALMRKYRRFFMGRRWGAPAMPLAIGWAGLGTALREWLRLAAPAADAKQGT